MGCAWHTLKEIIVDKTKLVMKIENVAMGEHHWTFLDMICKQWNVKREIILGGMCSCGSNDLMKIFKMNMDGLPKEEIEKYITKGEPISKENQERQAKIERGEGSINDMFDIKI